MTTERERGRPAYVPGGMVPWLVAAGALLLYLITLNRWVSFGNYGHVAKLAGWTWEAEFMAPVFLAVTYPIRWLPPSLIPAALNLFAAVCAALVLALLYRSVTLLPQDRTIAQRERERNEFGLLSIPLRWVPPLFAVLVCGLQISFWESATSSNSAEPWSKSSVMFDLLLLAYVIRCVLEYRIDERESWLFRAAFIVGLGMTNDWSMVGYLPLFVLCVLWIRGLNFFNAQFLVRMLAWGTAGLLAYFLLPVVNTLFHDPPVPFWYSLKDNLGGQRFWLQDMWAKKQVILVLSFTSLLPAVLMGIRWSSYFGDTSRTGTMLARTIFHIVHGFLLVACIWIALDPPVSPRNQRWNDMQLGVPFLSFYYLGSLVVGYLVGYFLLVFGPRRASRHLRPVSPQSRVMGRAVTVALWIVLVVTPVLLLAINLPRIRMANGPLLRHYAGSLVSSLPPGPTVVLSEDTSRMVLARAALIGKPEADRYIFAHTVSLIRPDAHAYLHRRHPQVWPLRLSLDRTKPVEDSDLLVLMAELARTHSVYYLHPSFGYYFETFHPEPQGLVNKLSFYEPQALLRPKLPPAVIETNLVFWTKLREESIEELAAAVDGIGIKRKGFMSGLMDKLHLKLALHPDALFAARHYSQALNYWGTELQRHDRFEEAGEAFNLAFRLNPDNVVAYINGTYNRQHRDNNPAPLPISKHITDEFGKYRTWADVLTHNGPYDEPGFNYSQGQEFRQNKLVRQAAFQFDRAVSLFPGHVPAGVELAGMFVVGNMPDKALELLNTVKANSDSGLRQTNQVALTGAEAAAHLAKGEPQKAAELFKELTMKLPADTNALDVAVNLFLHYNCPKESIPWADQRLKLTPNYPETLVNKGFAHMRIGEHQSAILALSSAISHITNNIELLDSALYNRAIAYLEAGELDKADADYRNLLSRYPDAPQVLYWLAELALRRKDTNAAIANFERYLLVTPAESGDAKVVRERLQQLKGGAP